MNHDDAMAAAAAIAAKVGEFYERHPYPPPVDDVDAYRQTWDARRRRAQSHLFWPRDAYRDDRSVLVAGCGTTQAAHYAVRWPRARIVGIDVSARSLASTQNLKQKHGLTNLEVRRLPVERAHELKETFEHVVCTGVLHHLSDPDAGLRALRSVLAPNGAIHIMVYAPYGRAGVYLLQAYCRRLGVGYGDREIRDLAESLKALPPEHPIVPLLRNSPDFSSGDALADALLHPQDRAYAVPELMDFLARGDLAFGRWIRQAPYLPVCGAIAATPHGARLERLPLLERYAAMELFRGTMVRHSLVAYPKRALAHVAPHDFESDAWRDDVPIRLPDTIVVRERLPAGASAVLINRNHTYTDLYLPIDARQDRLLTGIDGEKTVAAICGDFDRTVARDFFRQLWQWDQIVFDASRTSGA